MLKWAYALMFFLFGMIGLESTKEQLGGAMRDGGAAKQTTEQRATDG